jgi:serine/threonine-protein kinase
LTTTGAARTGNELSPDARVDAEELMSDLLRLRWLSSLGAVTWATLFLQDWAVVHYVHHGVLWHFLLIRGLGLIVILAVVRRLHDRRPLTRRQLNWLDLGVFSMVQAGISVLSLEYEGIASRYATGVIVALVSRSSVLAAHWRRGLMLLGIPVLFYPGTFVVASVFDANLRRQFADPSAIATFAQSLYVIAVSLGVCVWGGHGNWTMRRQLFESRSIGRYSLKRRIGRGGMGEVWVAHHAALHRDVALKILRPEQDSDPVALRRFEQEVAATTQLTHPNTVRVFDYGVTEDGIWYYAMELLDGVTLKELVHQSGQLEVRRALRIAHHVARALAEAHAHGIIHRDIKPENIFITTAGNETDLVKVLDFGIAKFKEFEGADSLTKPGSIFGTPAYMSPEAARGKDVGPASDVYGVGALLYFMLTGKPPFSGRNPTEVLLAHVERSAPNVTETPGVTVDTQVEQLVQRCLSKAPEQRYGDATKLADALGTIRRALG